MRILLVRPPVPRHAMGLKHIMVCEPLELEYVAAGLAGHEVEIIDMILERGLGRRLRRFKPDVVGTGSYIAGVNEAIKVCRAVKRWNPRCFTVVGGVHATLVPEDFSDAAVDCIVRCDGTSAMAELIEAIGAGRSLREVRGLALPRPDGSVESTGSRPYMPDPDSLPLPRRDLVARLSHRYYYLFHRPVAIVKTTWGCRHRCHFCFTWRITGGTPFSRGPESIVDELSRIEAEDIYIVDDTFLDDPERLSRIARLLRARGIRKKYLVFGRADFIAEHEAIIAEWAALGLCAVLVGLEATTDAELVSMGKTTSVDCNRRAVEVLRRNRVDIYASLIPRPDYTPADWAHLQTFIEDNGLYYLNISPLTPLPGTLIWDEWKDRVAVSRRAHGLWDLCHCVLPTRMPLKDYYRALLGVYARSMLDWRRAGRLALRVRPPFWSIASLRLWLGAVRIMFQFLNAHRHHGPRQLARAMSRGPETGRQ